MWSAARKSQGARAVVAMLGALVAIASIAVFEALALGATLVGLIEQSGPTGDTLQDRLTGLLKSFVQVTMMVDVADCPALTDAGVNGEANSVNFALEL